MRFVITGQPASQGSMTPVINWKQKRAWMRHQNGGAINVWRTLVRNAYREQGGVLIDQGPVRVAVKFGLARPANPANAYPVGDVDKYLRGLLDALTGTAYHDDSQVVQAYAIKVWGTQTIVLVEWGFPEWLAEDTDTGAEAGQIPLRLMW